MYILKEKYKKDNWDLNEFMIELDRFINSYTLFVNKTYKYLLKMNKKLAYNEFVVRTKAHKKALQLREDLNDKLNN